jgi:hypothetical protein
MHPAQQAGGWTFEAGSAIVAQHDGFAVQHRRRGDGPSDLRELGQGVGPEPPVTGHQPTTLAVDLDQRAKAVLEHPTRPARHRRGRRSKHRGDNHRHTLWPTVARAV